MQVESLHDGEQRKEETSALLPACCRHGTALAVRDPGQGTTTTTTTICLPRRRRGREMAAATAGSGACAQALFGRCRGSGPGLGARGWRRTMGLRRLLLRYYPPGAGLGGVGTAGWLGGELSVTTAFLACAPCSCGAQGSCCRAPVRQRRAAGVVLVMAACVGEAGVCTSPRSAEARGVEESKSRGN